MSEMAKADLPIDKIRAYCAKQPILRLSVLGSDFDGWLRPNTEVGFLADYVPGAIVSLLDMAGHEIDLGAIVGKGVSLHTSKGLKSGSLRDYVESARLIYEKQL